MTPTERALYLQRRRNRYQSRRDASLHRSSSASVSFAEPCPGSISSLGVASLAAPSLFASTSDGLQLLFPSQVDDVVSVLQSHVHRERNTKERLFGNFEPLFFISGFLRYMIWSSKIFFLELFWVAHLFNHNPSRPKASRCAEFEISSLSAELMTSYYVRWLFTICCLIWSHLIIIGALNLYSCEEILALHSSTNSHPFPPNAVLHIFRL